MQLATWNVNSLKVRLPQVLDWLAANPVDVLCLQELKQEDHAIVCIEDLQVRNMSKSSKGNAETHGKQVRQKSGLNRAILDQGWGEFRRQLDYKLAWRGGHLIAVPPHNTSRTCPACGHMSKENRRSQAQFACVACGYHNHADVVGAINVLERGHRLLACGESAQSGRSVKQEPAEAC